MDENNQQKGSERRKFPRKRTTIGITFSVLSPGQGVGIIKDISEGGFRFVTDKYLNTGTIIKAKFDLPQDGSSVSVETVAKVVWCKLTEEGYIIGVQVLT